ncbi:MAG: dihydrolipoyl dehydrogenase [Prevotella sp.]|nr:dihydrolipoyl dehydrogenase [Prevotella sp.]MDY3271294.1 dihydrolipoyl dehydrogenase [Prevotella sp.]MDY3876959.1 dihydrolipoyl dehydrogenase [Prevotella sp.]
MKTDLLIIGSGPGGYRAAGYAARNGLSVVVAERDQAGGTCLNAGCIPTKCLAHDASAAPSDFASAMERKALVTQQLRTGVEQLLSAPGITLVRGQAAFTDEHTVTIGDTTVEADNIIIATGSESRMPPITGIDNPRVITSTEALQLQSLPETMVIVGAGVIGMEFASILARFGSKVTVIEYLKECLPMFDKDIAKRLRKAIEKQGVTFFMDSAVSEITDEEVIFKSNKTGAETRLPCAGAPVLIATGRKPSVEGLNLEAAVVDYDTKGIKTDDCLRTSQPHIYAIGDVTGKQMLAHAATAMGFRAVNTILGKSDKIRLDIMPSAVFTYPEAATVGLSEDACKQLGKPCKCLKGYYRANGKALAIAEPEGMVKITADTDGTILGCTAYGAHSADMVQEIAALMNCNATTDDLASIIHIHPTLSEILQDMCLG